jgi:hypothetical protein
MGGRVHMPLSPVLQRRCACGGTPGPDGECAACKAKRLQRRAVGAGPAVAPPVVHEVLGSAGHPLEPAMRGDMEARFGHDFSRVRVHADAQAAVSAQAVGAAAYTVGRDVVFSAGRYAPGTEEGRSLIAHELTHVVQQAGSGQPSGELPVQPADHPAEREAERGVVTARQGPAVQRACLPAAECTSQEGSLTDFVKQSESDPAYVARQARRKTACSANPGGSACIGDGHGARAQALTAFLSSAAPGRLSLVTGIYVDKDIPVQYGAYTTACANSVPPISGGYCTFVPDWLESQAAAYNAPATSNTIGRWNRAEWRTMALTTLTHETEHARFLSPGVPTQGLCDPTSFQWDLSELAALTAGFLVVYRRSWRKPPEARRADLDDYFRWSVPIRRRSETIAGIVRFIRCQCECIDADAHIIRTVEFATQGWNSAELSVFHSELSDPKYGLRWPIKPPAAVSVEDLPPAIPTMDVEDLPIARRR